MSSDPNATQVGGSHYQGAYQHWDFVQYALDGRYLEGCATKYVARWRKKNGLQDLLKAKHYVEKLATMFGATDYPPMIKVGGHLSSTLSMIQRKEAEKFCEENLLKGDEREFMLKAATWGSAQDLLDLATILNRIIAVAQFGE